MKNNIVNSEYVKKQDIVVVVRNGSRNLIGKHALLTSTPHNPSVIGAFMTGIRSSDNQFIETLLNTEQFKREINKNLGATINQITTSQFKKMRFHFSKQKENKQIGVLFTYLDNSINLHERKCEELTLIKKALLQKFFPKKDEFKPEVRYKNFSNAWEQRKLGEVVNFLDTLRKPLEGAKRVKGPYPYYGASGIVDYVDGYLFDEELILLSEDGANITERNYPVCFLASGKYWVNNHAHVLKIKEDNDNNFICNSLERKDYTKYNTGMAMPKLNKETCKGIPIMCPNYDEQKKIGNYFRKFDTLIALHQRKLEKLKQLKKFLLQNMFI